MARAAGVDPNDPLTPDRSDYSFRTKEEGSEISSSKTSNFSTVRSRPAKIFSQLRSECYRRRNTLNSGFR